MNAKRNILLVTPDFMEYTDMIYSGIEKYLDAEVQLITTTGEGLKFTYQNSFDRLKNFLSKLFLGKNLKKIFYHNAIAQKLENVFSEYPSFDDILILRPDLIREHLPEIKMHGRRMIAYFWDSFARIPRGKESIRYFDKFFSFEPKDVKEHKLIFAPNFCPPIAAVNEIKQPEFDLSYVASYDERVETMERVLATLRPLNLKTNINVVSARKFHAGNRNEKDITWFSDVLPRKESIRIINNSKALLDIAQPNQEGLSFRIFEAVAMEKKLITTNAAIRSYDLYDADNIFVWSEELPLPPQEFFTRPYSPLPVEITAKYSLLSWVKKIFE